MKYRRVKLACLSVAFLLGCRPSVPASAPAQLAMQRASGTLSLQVTLPRQAQALVANTQSVKILLRNPGLLGTDRFLIANGSGPQTLTLSALPPGNGYALYAGAYSGLNATGTLMSWGQLPLVIQSGVNNASLGLSVRVAPGTSLDDIINGPAGSGTRIGSTQWVQTSIQDFTPGTSSNTELFVPGLYGYLGSLGSLGSGVGQFNMVEDVAFDPYGRMYVCDRNNDRIQVFDSSFNFQRAWGNGTVWTAGPAPTPVASDANGYFNQPTGLTLDAMGNVYVADQLNDRIQKFDSNGTFIQGWGSGTTWVNGQAAPAVSSGTGADQFYNPHKPRVDRDGNVWISDLANNRILKYSPNGVFLLGIGSGTTWTVASSAPTPASGSANGFFWSPWWNSPDAEGNIFVGDLWNSRVQEFTPTGAYLSQWGTAGSLDGQFPGGAGVMAFDPFGRVWAANFNTTSGLNYLQVFTPAGQYQARLTGPTASQLQQARALGFDSAGTAYVGDVNSGVISKFQGTSASDASGGVRLAGTRAVVGPSNFAASGTYASPVLDAQSAVTWGSIYWVVSNLPAGTGVAVSVATSSDRVGWGPWAQVAGTSFAGNNLVSLSGSAYSSRFLKYQLTLTTTSAATTSEVQEVGVIY